MGYPREEIEEMLRRYMAANVKGEQIRLEAVPAVGTGAGAEAFFRCRAA